MTETFRKDANFANIGALFLAVGAGALLYGPSFVCGPAWAIDTPDGSIPDTISVKHKVDEEPRSDTPEHPTDEATQAGLGFYTYSYFYAPGSGKDNYFLSNTGFFKGETTGSIFQAKGFFEGVVIEKPATTWTIEAPEAYVGSSPELSKIVQVRIGRELHHWNHLDEEFQTGIWQPRFRWDYVHPQTVGLAGVHVDVTTRYFQFNAMGSPMFVPDRGIPVEFQNNGVYSINPYFVSPANTLNYEGVPTAVSYSLQQPNLTTILFHPGASAMARVGEQQGVWGSVAGAYIPMNQLLFSYSGNADLGPNQNIDATLYPRVAYHQLLSVESGYETGSFGTWLSALEDRPVDSETVLGSDSQVVTLSRAVGPSAEFRVGDLKFAPTKFRVSAMKQWGGNAPDAGPDSSGAASVFENRYFSHMAGVFYTESPLGFMGIHNASVSYRLLADIEHDGTIQSTDLYYTFARSIVVNVGTDVLSSGEDPSAPDPISQYRANDRVRLGVSYVF